jgi:hypothetical protein
MEQSVRLWGMTNPIGGLVDQWYMVIQHQIRFPSLKKLLQVL